MNKVLVIMMMSVFCVVQGFSQIGNSLTLYQQNFNILNPAYAGSQEKLDIGIMHTWFNSNFLKTEEKHGDSSPFLVLNLHTPIAKGFGAGVSFENVKTKYKQEIDYAFDLSYSMKLSEISSLSLGLKGGESTILWEDQALQEMIWNDPYLENLIDSKQRYRNIGLGFYYKTDKFFSGLSWLNYNTKDATFYSQLDNFSLINSFVGYVFKLSDKVKLSPKIIAVYDKEGDYAWGSITGSLMTEAIDISLHYSYSKAFALTLKTPQIMKTLEMGLYIDTFKKSYYVSSGSSNDYYVNFTTKTYNHQSVSLFANINIDLWRND